MKKRVTNVLTDPAMNMGFVELINAPSMYYNKDRDIMLSIHVDDPIIMTSKQSSEAWFYEQLRHYFEIKDVTHLTVGNCVTFLPFLHYCLANSEQVCRPNSGAS